MGIQATAAVAVTSLGIFGDLNSESYDVVIYASTDGNQAGAVLAQASGVAGGTGTRWYDLPVSYTLQPGQYYVLHWKPTVSNSLWALNLEYTPDANLPFTVGPIVMINGAEGFDAAALGFDNSLHPSFRLGVQAVDATPIPVMSLHVLGMMTFGLLTLAARHLSRRKWCWASGAPKWAWANRWPRLLKLRGWYKPLRSAKGFDRGAESDRSAYLPLASPQRFA